METFDIIIGGGRGVIASLEAKLVPGREAGAVAALEYTLKKYKIILLPGKKPASFYKTMVKCSNLAA